VNRFDAIVLGAGIGGLTAAALLARAGRSVLLLERGAAPGGVFGSYSPAQGEHGYRFALSAAPLDGLEPGGPLADIAALLRVRFPAERQRPSLRTWLPDRVVADPGDGRAGLASEISGAVRFWRHQERVAELRRGNGRSPLLFAHRARTVADELRRCRLSDPALLAYIDAQLVALGLPPAARCPWLVGSAALDMPRRGLFIAPGGAQTVAEVLADAFVRDGGELRLRTPARELLVESGRACGVRADDAEYRAPHVVLAAPQPALLAHALYVAVDAAVAPADVGCYHRVSLDGAFVALALSPARNAMGAPAAQRLVTTTISEGAEGYLGERAERLLAEAVERVLPGALAGAGFRHYAEPAALARLLDAAPALLAPSSHVDGVWVASDGGIVNAGTGAAALSGIAAYEGIQRALDWSARRRELALLRRHRAP
jgi:phytoene dehydrogenase-like protein